MAQDITGRVWYFDAVTAAGDDLHKNGFNRQQVKVGNIVFSEATAAGHECVVKDFQGRVIFKSIADAPNDLDRSGKIGWVEGINIAALDSGVVMIHMDDK